MVSTVLCHLWDAELIPRYVGMIGTLYILYVHSSLSRLLLDSSLMCRVILVFQLPPLLPTVVRVYSTTSPHPAVANLASDR